MKGILVIMMMNGKKNSKKDRCKSLRTPLRRWCPYSVPNCLTDTLFFFHANREYEITRGLVPDGYTIIASTHNVFLLSRGSIGIFVKQSYHCFICLLMVHCLVDLRSQRRDHGNHSVRRWRVHDRTGDNIDHVPVVHSR